MGFGGSPDEDGETTLDAMVMDGQTLDIGAVGALRGVKDAVAAARLVLERTDHTLLVGDQAARFAIEMGLAPANLTTAESAAMHAQWRAGNCQPNFRRNVAPDPGKFCGPYVTDGGDGGGDGAEPGGGGTGAGGTGGGVSSGGGGGSSGGGDVLSLRRPAKRASGDVTRHNHDTIAMFARDAAGRMFGATSTNGARGKVPGRVGDSPIPGAGLYVVTGIGGCGATGDGDVMMRFLPCYQAVWLWLHMYNTASLVLLTKCLCVILGDLTSCH